MRNSGPFYLAMKERPKTLGWYKWPGMGINNINSFMYEEYGTGVAIFCSEIYLK